MHRALYGDYLANAQGEDVVNGSRVTSEPTQPQAVLPHAYDALQRHANTLEQSFLDMCDIEFTIEDGQLWLLQVRVGKRSPSAAFRIAVDLVDEGRIDLDEALRRVDGTQLQSLLHPSSLRRTEPRWSGAASRPARERPSERSSSTPRRRPRGRAPVAR